ncbi:hypothetical protein POM88_011519 [Heracleum sosnowskyi]|uniref:Uncharacterized protein n=1 Tax=Heracleum sosnowskyi TaxID=360622 RepID=A0AAD8N2H2_9APIA|nr:hypothetical protein POM88_011519 [Heracleum sosnowskyi]
MEMLRFGEFDPVPVFNAAKHGTTENSDVDVVGEQMSDFEKRIIDIQIKRNLKNYFLIAIDTTTQKSHGLKMQLSVDTSKETMIQELGNRALRYDFVPSDTLFPTMVPTLTGATQLVSVEGCIVGIGGGQWHVKVTIQIRLRALRSTTVAFTFALNAAEEGGHIQPLSLLEGIYMFLVGLHPSKKIGCTQLFAFPYDTQTILIGCGVLPDKDGLLYNVPDKSWSRYQSFPKIHPWNFARPVTFDSTIYWIEGLFLMAYEMEKRIYLRVDLSESVFSYESFLSPAHVPHLVHLEDDLFGFFTSSVFGQEAKGVECTKVRVTKVYSAYMDLPGTLDLTVVGYENFMCSRIDMLSSVVSCGIATHFILHESGIKNLADLPMLILHKRNCRGINLFWSGLCRVSN